MNEKTKDLIVGLLVVFLLAVAVYLASEAERPARPTDEPGAPAVVVWSVAEPRALRASAVKESSPQRR